MKNLLYIGNKLSHKNKTVTTIETLSQNLRKEGFIVYSVSSKKNRVFRLCDMLWHVIKYRNRVEYVLIDTYSTINFYYAYLCSLLCRFFNLKYIPILHGGNLPERLKTSPKKSNHLFRNAYINIAPSLFLKSHFESHGYTNLEYIPNTIELNHYNFDKRTFKEARLLWVRSFSSIYNPELAVKVLKILRENNIEATLCMVGPRNDDSLDSTKSLARELGVEVEFTGKLSKKDWHKKAEGFNIFINTTNVDNTPVSVIEAMALGLPIISTNVGGMPFLIEDGEDGILVPPNDEVAFKDAVCRLIEDRNLGKNIADKARKKVESFDWEVVKHKWFSVLS
ncbi:hypothetical protein MHTCC0001_05490 [Flavobacteriaceae bacterium MHTCC 0001]